MSAFSVLYIFIACIFENKAKKRYTIPAMFELNGCGNVNDPRPNRNMFVSNSLYDCMHKRHSNDRACIQWYNVAFDECFLLLWYFVRVALRWNRF